ncbi:MAG: U32 family peptidase [Treponema sp.]|nr:U32 family peptidase [Treponema sp.]
MTELLAPAGNIESLDAAIGEGADAVYLGLKSFNARLRTSNFAWNQFEAAVQSVHRQGKKIYVTVNTVCEERETERLYRFLSYLDKVGPDGLIVQDLAVVRMCQEFFPNFELHASTQMNVESASAANLLKGEGLSRVVLARELGLDEIKKIKESTNAELEMFVHGALCVSESGLCLFSSFLGGKSANRGMCTQACRRFYTAEYPEGIKQGYYFSPCDMQLIEHVPELMDIGVDSFKIEGRMKSAEYVGSVVAAYRYVMDHWKEDKKGAIATGKRMLSSDFARSKTDYWYGFKSIQEGVDNAGEKILNPDQAGGTGIYLGKIAQVRKAPDELIEEVNKNASADTLAEQLRIHMVRLTGGSYDPDPGDSVRVHSKNDTGRMSHKIRSVQIEDNGERWMDLPASFGVGDSVYLLQIKSMSKRYNRVLPGDLSKFRRQPLDEQLPVLDLTPVERKELDFFPEGIYVQVSSIADVFTAQGLHPVRVLIEYNSETKDDLLNGKTVLPFSKKAIFISLDPFCAGSGESQLKSELTKLLEDGYRNFVANNIAHLEMLKGTQANVIAGPFLYTFNRWAVSWFENQNVRGFVMPYENSRRNLEATFDENVRSRVLVPVFAYPSLFRIRFKMPESYGFNYFSDKEGAQFRIATSDDGSVVMPELPFSLLDKTEFLAQAGFKRFLIDFSHTKMNRSQVKDVTASLIKKQMLPDVSRFNWKDGFYNPERIEEFKASNERAAAARIAMQKGGRPVRGNSEQSGKAGWTNRAGARYDNHHKKNGRNAQMGKFGFNGKGKR